MDESLQPPRRRRFRLRSPIPLRRGLQVALVLAGVVVVADALVGNQGLVAILRARRQHDALASLVERERAENARLSEQARRLRDDPTAIEEIARRELGLIKPGEKVFIIKDLPPAK